MFTECLLIVYWVSTDCLLSFYWVSNVSEYIMSKHYVCTSSTRQNNKSKDKYVIMLKRVYTLKFKKLLRISIEE